MVRAPPLEIDLIMRVGLVTFYAHRPHVHHMVYLAHLLRQAGHEPRFLTCDASVPACHNLLLKGARRASECPRCMAGGLRSFPVGPIRGMRAGERGEVPPSQLASWIASSAYRLVLTESAEDLAAPEVRAIQAALEVPVDIAFGNARAWIREDRLDALLLYNGRMDLTRAVFEAGTAAGIPVASVETPWTGHGIVLFPNQMCLSLSEMDRMNRRYGGIPLAERQAREAAQVLARRFLRQNRLEWRVYNEQAVRAPWPVSTTGLKVLVLPSSRNEVEGHPDWTSEWQDYPMAFDALLSRLGVAAGDVVVRCHPNWAERFGRASGWRSERHYREWATRRSHCLIPSAAAADTYDLMRSADLVLVNGGTSGLEAAALGRRVISLGHSYYQEAGCSLHLHGWADLEAAARYGWPDAGEIRRRALRFVYTYSRRLVQFVDFVRAESSFRRRFYDGADPARLTRLLATGRVEPDDPEEATDAGAEQVVVDAMAAGRWQDLASWEPPGQSTPELPIRRRRLLRWLDRARERLPVGDRMG